MQAIHIDEHVYNVRRDNPWDAGSNAGAVCAFSNSPGTDLRVWDTFDALSASCLARILLTYGGPRPERLCRRDVARRSRGRPARSARRLRSGEARRWLVRRRTDRPGIIVPGAIRAGNSDKV